MFFAFYCGALSEPGHCHTNLARANVRRATPRQPWSVVCHLCSRSVSSCFCPLLTIVQTNPPSSRDCDRSLGTCIRLTVVYINMCCVGPWAMSALKVWFRLYRTSRPNANIVSCFTSPNTLHELMTKHNIFDLSPTRGVTNVCGTPLVDRG